MPGPRFARDHRLSTWQRKLVVQGGAVESSLKESLGCVGHEFRVMGAQ